MALKFKYMSKDEVPAEHAALYVERDGAFVLEAEGAVDKARVDEFRTNNLTLRTQLDELTRKFEGIEPESVKQLLAEKARLEEEKLLKAGEVEKLIEKRTRAAVSEWEKRTQSAEGQLVTLTARLVETEINRSAVEAATKLGLRPTALADIQARAQKTFKIQDGTAMAFEADGKTPVSGRDGASPLSFEEWAARQVIEAPHLFESSAGSGAVGHGSGGVGQRKNPFRKGADWNLTEQMRLLKTDPRMAERLRAAA